MSSDETNGQPPSTSKRDQRYDRKRKRIEAEYRLLASSGKSELCVLSSTMASSTVTTMPTTTMNNQQRRREDLIELKRQRDASVIPKFYFKNTTTTSSDGGDEEGDSDRVRVELRDLYSLILYSQFGNEAPQTPRWCGLSAWRRISQTVLLMIDTGGGGRSIDDEEEVTKDLGFLRGNFVRRFDVNIPRRTNDQDFYNGLLRVQTPFLKLLQETLGESWGFRNIDKDDPDDDDDQYEDGNLVSKLDLLLSPLEMAEEDFPLPDYYYPGRPIEFVYSRPSYAKPTARSPIYAIDCEMCITGPNRREVTRVSIVDERCRIVLDTLVKPEYPIIDYLTPVSGITPAMMDGAYRRLEDVQALLEYLIEPDAIVCGHSLNFDLNALRVFHPYVIDTSLIYNLKGRRQARSSLRDLSSMFLNGLSIQQSAKGHCSIEDAYATMQLVKRKLGEGYNFGNIMTGWSYDEVLKSISSSSSNDDDDESDLELEIDDGGPPAKRVRHDTPCSGCGQTIQLVCLNDDCRCRSLTRFCSWSCKQDSNGEQQRRNTLVDEDEEIDRDELLAEWFPPIAFDYDDDGFRNNIGTLLRKGRKRMLFVSSSKSKPPRIVDSNNSGGESGNGKKTKKNFRVIIERHNPGGAVDNALSVVAHFRCSQFEYDLNILETSSNKNLDRQIESIVKHTSGKSLICVLFCDRYNPADQVGQCYLMVRGIEGCFFTSD